MKFLTLVCSFVFILLFFNPPLFAQDYRELIQLSDSLSDAHNNDSAAVIAQQALETAETEFGLTDTTVATILTRYYLYLVNLYQYADAEVMCERALNIRESALGPDDIGVAECLMDLAYLRSKLEKFADVEALYLRSLHIKEEILGLSHSEVGGCLLFLSRFYMSQARYDEAEDLAIRSLAMTEKNEGLGSPEVANNLSLLAEIYKFQNRYDLAVDFFLRALAIEEKSLGFEDLATATTLNSLADTYNSHGKFPKAEPLFKRSITIFEKVLGADHLNVGITKNNLAMLFVGIGRYREAEPLMKSAITIIQNTIGRYNQHMAILNNNLAALYAEQARYAEAESLARNSLLIIEKTLGPNHPTVAAVLNNLANYNLSLGRFAEAEKLSLRALEIREAQLGAEHRDVLFCLNALGRIYFHQGRLVDAEKVFKRSVDIAETLENRMDPEIATAYNVLANLYKRLEKFSEAETFYNRALDITEAVFGEDHQKTAVLYTHLGDVFRNQKRYVQAEEYYNKALEIWENSYNWNSYDAAETLASMSKLHRLQNNNSDALKLAESTVMMRLNNFSNNIRFMSEKDAITFSRELHMSIDKYLSCYVDIEIYEDSTTKGVANIISLCKGIITDHMLERQKHLISDTDSTLTILAESLRATKYELSRLFIESPENDIATYTSKVDSLELLANSIEVELTIKSSSYRESKIADVSIDRIRGMLPDDCTLIEYVKYEYYTVNSDKIIPGYLVVVAKKDTEPVIVDLGKASQIDGLVTEYRQHILRVSNSQGYATEEDSQEYDLICKKLYDRIMLPIDRYVGDSRILNIAPDGALNMISWAGLKDSENSFLVENFIINYISSGRDIIRNQDSRTQGKGLLAFGDPDYDATVSSRLACKSNPVDKPSDGRQYSSTSLRSACGKLSDILLNPLPGARAEIETVASEWLLNNSEPASVYLGTDATEGRFKNESSGFSVIHLATHGYFLGESCISSPSEEGVASKSRLASENPLLRSGLFLAGANLHGEGSDSVGIDDGILTAYEISALNLEGTRLVVLSACESGLGEIEASEGVYGLRRAFQMAGAQTIVTALWSVSDFSTSEILGSLYSEKMTLPEVIQKAQLRKIDNLRVNNMPDHPFSWGAFVSIGDLRY